MGRKVFVSYKYSDAQVQDLNIYANTFFGRQKIQTTARHYVDALAELLENEDHIYQGEDDGESLATLSDAKIASKLGDKIFGSSVTVVLISKGMKVSGLSEREQWMPWEISYSLREQSRQGVNSKMNGVLAVVLPDSFGSYSYYMTYNSECNSTNFYTHNLFQILRDNMFNVKEPDRNPCNGSWIYKGDYSYIKSVSWVDFISAPTIYIDKAIQLRDRQHEFNICKTVG